MDNTEKVSVIVTGSNGLIGSKFVSEAADDFEIIPADINSETNPVDITNKSQVFELIEKTQPVALVHFAAFTNVTAAWEQSEDKNGPAFLVNVVGTQNIIAACEQYGVHLIHISTAYVFDGTKNEMYIESDSPNPIEWYGKTKAIAEEAVLNSTCLNTVFRIDQPFRSDDFARHDVVRRTVRGMLTDSLYPQFTDHFFAATYIDDFATVLRWAITEKKAGIYHCTTNTKVSDFEFATHIQQQLEIEYAIKKTTLVEYLKTTVRPYQQNTALNSDKLLRDSQLQLLSLPEALASVVIDLDALATDAT